MNTSRLVFPSILLVLDLSIEQKHDGAVHLVMDGWTSPILACYLGIVAIWYSQGHLHRCILEFVRYRCLLSPTFATY